MTDFYKPKKGDTIRIIDYPDKMFFTEHHKKPECPMCEKGHPLYDIQVTRKDGKIYFKKVARIKHRIQALEID